MFIVDTALAIRQAEGRPVRVGVVGAGFAGRGLVLQLVNGAPGVELVCVSNRTVAEAERAWKEAGVDDPLFVDSPRALEEAIARGQAAFTDNPDVICEAGQVDAVVEITGEIEFGARVSLKAISCGKHLVLMNAELDATLGPILKVYADRAGVVFTDADGDQPGLIMNLMRYVQFLGFKPVLLGNIKSLLDHYRTPATQKDWAARHFQRPKHVTSFADGTKISVEMATLANGAGMGVGKRGMYGPPATHVDEAPGLFAAEEMLGGGLVDYILGAQPSFGVFVIGYSENPLKQRYMRVYKMGDGPFYTFYTPHHLSPIEAPLSVARAVLFKDAALAPIGAPVCEVVAIAKRDLAAGEVLDGIGGFTCYGTIDNSPVCRRENLLPMGLSEGCRLKRAVPKDQPLSFDDVELPADRLADRLWNEQLVHFGLAARPLQLT